MKIQQALNKGDIYEFDREGYIAWYRIKVIGVLFVADYITHVKINGTNDDGTVHVGFGSMSQNEFVYDHVGVFSCPRRFILSDSDIIIS